MNEMDSPATRQAGPDVLSLALIDARNRTLHLMAEYERLVPSLDFSQHLSTPLAAEIVPPQWLLGHVGWFQELWLGRNVQRTLGMQCPSAPALLSSIHPQADACFDPRMATRAERWRINYPDLSTLKSYLLETLETTLDLLEKAPATPDGLYLFRLALAHEDHIGEQFVQMAQSLGLKLPAPTQNAYGQRPAILVPACTWGLGASQAGFAFDNEWPQHEVRVPEFEIDAQPLSWAQYVEFVGDGGYDNAAHWSAAGLQWLQAACADVGQSQNHEGARRAPRYVEQIGAASGAVMAMRFGQIQRIASGCAVMHLNWHEASAYARWAGRRLPTEVEWEIAASRLQGQGFAWGQVWEWTCNTFRPYEGFAPSPWQRGSAAHFEHCKALRGASWATRERMKAPTLRGYARPERDYGFFGFRTCAI